MTGLTNSDTIQSKYICEAFSLIFQGMIALRRGATELLHEDYMDGIIEVSAKKKKNLQYYA